MTKRYPLRGTLGGGYTRNSGYFQGVAFGVLQALNGGHYTGFHADKGLCYGSPPGCPFAGDVHHLHFAFGAVVGELWHGDSLQGPNGRTAREAQGSGETITSGNVFPQEDWHALAGFDVLLVRLHN